MYAETSDQVKKLADNPSWKVLRNDENCQAVEFEGEEVMAAFFGEGRLQLKGKKSVSVDRPCLVEITNDTFYLSDPFHKGGVVHLTLAGKTYPVNLNNDGTTTSFKATKGGQG